MTSPLFATRRIVDSSVRFMSRHIKLYQNSPIKFNSALTVIEFLITRRHFERRKKIRCNNMYICVHIKL